MTSKRQQRSGPYSVPIYILAAVAAAITGFVVAQLEFKAPEPAGQSPAVSELGGTGTDKAAPGQSPGADVSGKAGLAALAKGPVETFVAHPSPKEVPEFTFVDENGARKSLNDWRGRIVLLNIWATWCAPCREEMPSLSRLQEKLGGEDFAVVPVSVDRKGIEAVRKFLDEIGVHNLPALIDPAARLNFKVRALGLPATLLIDRQGREIGRMVGPAEWDSPEAVALLRAAIAK